MDTNFITMKVQAGESFLLSNDGQYLGKLTLSQYDSESLFNPYGSYGSQYSPTSIFNRYGNYGSAYSALSPYNPYTSTPPAIYLKGNFFGYLSKNQYLGTKVVDPQHINYWMKENNLNY